MMNMRLSDDFLVCVAIHEHHIKNEKVWFGKLAEEMDGVLNRVAVSRALDRLSDRGMIEGRWDEIDRGRWAFTFNIDEDFEGFVESLYDVSSERHC